MPHFKEFTMLCICKPISVVMPFLYNASNFVFPTARLQKVWLQSVQMQWPSHQDCFYIWITFSSPNLMNSKCRIKPNASNMNATWIVKLDIWLCTECCIGFIIIQNNFLHCLYYALLRDHIKLNLNTVLG